MTKAILVMDMPDSCLHCRLTLHIYDKNDYQIWCPYGFISHGIADERCNNKPDWCPLIPEPNRREPGDAVGYTEGEPLTEELVEKLIDFGFDECLDEIEMEADGKT